MNPQTTVQPSSTHRPSPSPEGHYCNCALPIAVERAERRGAAYRVCARCGLPIAVRWSRW